MLDLDAGILVLILVFYAAVTWCVSFYLHFRRVTEQAGVSAVFLVIDDARLFDCKYISK